MKVIIGGNPAPPAPKVETLCIYEDAADQRVDNFLIRHLKGVPKTHIYRMIRSGEVRVNKGRVSVDTRLQVGDVLRVPPVRISERVNSSRGPWMWRSSFLRVAQNASIAALSKQSPTLP